MSQLFGFVFTVAVCLALGRREQIFFRFVTGAAFLSLLVLAACTLHIAYPFVFLIIGLLVVGQASGLSLDRSETCPTGVILAFAAFGTLYFFHAMAPEMSPDGTGYHLGLVSRYLREHGFHLINTTFYANLPQGAEMLFLFAFA